MAEARERLEAAHVLIERRLLGAAVSDGYYAILYAARAALSERERNAKTHRGTWSLFHEEYVAAGAFDANLAGEARATQEPREGVEYAAARISLEGESSTWPSASSRRSNRSSRPRLGPKRWLRR